jgi:probable phosphoglycerate mutase
MYRTTHILIVRHGQTDANAGGRLQGHQPTPLNMAGLRQANLLAGRLAGYAPAAGVIISSDLPRATQTAGPIAAACGLSIQTDPAWRERGFGLLEGKPIGNEKLWQVAAGEIDPPGAEPSSDFQTRIRSALLAIPKLYAEHKVVIVVTHGGPMRSILKMLADGRLETIRGHDPIEIVTVPNCSILHLIARHHRTGIRWKIETINDISHLAEF